MSPQVRSSWQNPAKVVAKCLNALLLFLKKITFLSKPQLSSKWFSNEKHVYSTNT